MTAYLHKSMKEIFSCEVVVLLPFLKGHLSSLHFVAMHIAPVIDCLQSRTRVLAAVRAECSRCLTNTSLPLRLSPPH